MDGKTLSTFPSLLLMVFPTFFPYFPLWFLGAQDVGELMFFGFWILFLINSPINDMKEGPQESKTQGTRT